MTSQVDTTTKHDTRTARKGGHFSTQGNKMKKQYFVRWKSDITGLIGQGSAIMTYEDARTWCREADVKFHKLTHWPVSLKSQRGRK